MTIVDAISQAVTKKSLSESESRLVMDQIMRGEATGAQIAALLVALRMKGESVAEIVGFARAMRQGAVTVKHGKQAVVDTCGTGGDAVKTFNLSTAAAIIASAAGVTVAKHGNRAVTSKCGSADVLEALGVDLSRDPGESLQKFGLAFLFAPNHHPSMKHAAAPRREIRLRTIFNLVGPLTNPALADRQLLGVYSSALVPKMARALSRLGCRKGVVAHGLIGIDEVSPVGRTVVAVIEGSHISASELEPADFGIEEPKLAQITMSEGGPEEAATMLLRAITEPDSAECRAVLPGASVAIWLGELAVDFRAAAEIARSAVASGAACEQLRNLQGGTVV